MTACRPFIVISALCLFLIAPAAMHAQEVDAFDGTVYNEKQKELINITSLTDMLELDEHQVEFIMEMQKEMQERLRDESEILKDKPKELKRVSNDLRFELQERVKEVLRPSQLMKYEKFLRSEKERKVKNESGMQGDEADEAPTDPDKAK
jgi:hypothetical protein